MWLVARKVGKPIELIQGFGDDEAASEAEEEPEPIIYRLEDKQQEPMTESKLELM